MQGVFFRRFVQQHAQGLGLRGWVRNLSDGASVEVVAEGRSDQLETLVKFLRLGPRGSWVEDVGLKWLPPTDSYDDFRIW